LKIIRGRSVRINLGNYEHIETNASVELELEENEDPVHYAKELDTQLNKLLEDDLHDAESSTSLDENSSFVYTWNELKK
jgi:hypothetical protein